MRLRHSAGLMVAFAAAAGPALAQTPLSPPEVGNQAVILSRQRPPVIIGTFTVDGTVMYDESVLPAARLVFKPGATLVFSSAALQEGPNLFIFARDIESQDPQHPGKITWQKIPFAAPPALGTAPAGVDNGAREEAAGGNGQNGRMGYYGHPGEAGPDLTIITDKLSPSLLVDVSGSDGGLGGMGESGSRGGATVIQLARVGSIAIVGQATGREAEMVEAADRGERVAIAVEAAFSR